MLALKTQVWKTLVLASLATTFTKGASVDYSGNGSNIELSEINSLAMDWIEIYNPSNESIDLTGYSIVYDGKATKTYTFGGDCGKIEAKTYMLIVDEDAKNPEYSNGDCKLSFGIKSTGSVDLIDATGTKIDQTSWANVAYVAGHSWSKNSKGSWEATSAATPFKPNLIQTPITMDTNVAFNDGLKDRDIAYIQDPKVGSITNIRLTVPSSSDSCTCNKYNAAHNDELCNCTWNDVLNDTDSLDLSQIVMPCAVSVDVDGVPEHWYEEDGVTPRSTQNCVVKQRGGYTREAEIKSFSIKMNKYMVPRDWRGLKRMNLVKAPWDYSGVRVHTVFEQFKVMEDFHSLRQLVANLTVTEVNPTNGDVVSVTNMGHYIFFENNDEDALDRHGMAANDMNGDRKEAHYYKLRDVDFAWVSSYANIVPTVDETDENAMIALESYLEPKDSEDNTKFVQTVMELNGMTNPPMTFPEAVEKRFDLDNVATWMAVNIMCGDTDHNGKNLFIYSNNDTEKWFYSPWDYDQCWNQPMDDGPPSLSLQRYQDSDIIGHKEWDKDEIENFVYDAEKDMYAASPRQVFFGQYDFVNKTILDNRNMPPLLHSAMELSDGVVGSFVVSHKPMVQEEGNSVEVYVQVYKNRPVYDDDSFSGMGEGISMFEARFWEPKPEDLISTFKEGVDGTMVQSSSSSTQYQFSCDTVAACKTTECWVTLYTVDTVRNVQGSPGRTTAQALFTVC
eukprot:CFRG1091T1